MNDEESQFSSSIYQGSYADITIGNLRTYSGDVHRTKSYLQNDKDIQNGFFKIADFVLQSDNQLIDSESLLKTQSDYFTLNQLLIIIGKVHQTLQHKEIHI